MPEQPDDLVTALAQVMESTMFAGSPDPSPNARWQWARLARAVIDSGLVLPTADVIPKQGVEWDWEWGVALGGTVSVANRYTEAWCRDYVATARADGHPEPRVVRRAVARGMWETAPDLRPLIARGES